MKIQITKFDEALVKEAEHFLRGADQNPESLALLRRFGLSDEEMTRGRELVENAKRAFEWERRGKAWNFLSPTPKKREAEARHWYADTRRRWVRACLRRAEEAAGWVGNEPSREWPLPKKLTSGTALALVHAVRAASPLAWLGHRAELRENLEAAQGERPSDAPPPKDSALVELAGWYEHWRLLAQRVFRDRPDLLSPFGLTAGKAPPRLRSRSARAKYGERAASAPQANGSSQDEAEDLVDQGLALEEPKPARPADDASRGKSLPIL